MKATKARTKGQARRAPKTRTEALEAPPHPQVEGPTTHAAQHGRYARSDAPRAPYVNDASTHLGRLMVNGSITRLQRVNGEAFAQTWEAVWGSEGKDSTQPRVGGIVHETRAQALTYIARRELLNRVLNAIPGSMRDRPRAYNVLIDVAAKGIALGRDRGVRRDDYARLRRALDACVVVFDVPA